MTSQRVVRRFLFGLLILVVLIYGFKFFQSLGGRLGDAIPSNTEDMIAAIQYGRDGQSAVVIDKNGKVTQNSGFKEGVTDRDLTWNPSGNRLFFVSDRKEEAFHIFIWNPQGNSTPEQRTVEKSGKSYPSFDVQGGADADKQMLITSRGIVQEFRPIDGSTPQVLPPSKKEIAAGRGEDEGESAAGTFEQAYRNIGKSFRVAKWLKERKFVAAVMRREEGEVLIIQKLERDSDGKFPAPQTIITAEKIEIAVDPASGNLVYAALDFSYPNLESIPKDMIKNGKITRPFSHCLGIVDPTSPSNPETSGLIIASPDDKACFSSPAVTPDGSSVVVVVGPYDGNGGVNSKALLSMPLRVGGGQSQSLLIQGEIYEPAWHPKGTKLAFVKKVGTKRAIFLANADGSNIANLTGENGNFGMPQFSPQAK